MNIPVGLYSATNARSAINLDLLRDSDHSRIRYKKVAEVDGKEVPPEHIVKGYEFEKENFVVLQEEDFKRVEIPSNQTVDIREFVKLADIDPRYFDKPYYLAPMKGGAKAYALLRAALEETGLAAIAKVVIRPPREHLALLKPLNGLLVLETLHFADEIRDPSDLEVPKAELGRKELEMAISLVNTMMDEWKPEKYHDEYREKLMQVIEQKTKSGGRKLPAPKEPKTGPQKVIDLVALLEESLGQKGKGRKAKAPRPQRLQKKAA